MKKFIIPGLCLLSLTSCETVRTVYDDNGHEIQEHTGGERSLEDYMQETFDKDVTRKKTEDGVPESSSNKVSRYQKDIDAARRDDKTFSTGTFSGTGAFSGMDRDFSGSNKKFDTGSPYAGTYGSSSISRDLRPDFLSDTKGVFSRDDTYGISAADRSEVDGQGYDDFSPIHTYGTGYSDISRDTTSGYYESRKNKHGQPRIISHRDYYRKTIHDTRSLLGRDNETEEE